MAFRFFLTLTLTLPLPLTARANSASAAKRLNEISDQLQLALTYSVPADKYQEIQGSLDIFGRQHATALKSNPALRQNFNKLKKISVIQMKFKECLKRFSNESSLGRRIVTMAFDLDATRIDCTTDREGTAELIQDLQVGIDAAMVTHLRTGMISKVRTNSATNLADIMYRVRMEPRNPRSHNGFVRSAALDAVCGDNCTPEDRRRLQADIDRHINKLEAENAETLSLREVMFQLQSKVDHINGIVNQVFESEDDGTLVYNEYAREFWNETSSGIGLLMHTESIRDKMGEFQPFEGMDKVRGGRYKLDLDRHGEKFSESHVKNAYNEYVTMMKDLSREVATEYMKAPRNIQEEREAVKKMLKSYPLAAAQMLLDQPAYTGLICDLINELEDQDEKDDKSTFVRRLFLGVTGGALAIGGLALSFTGAGSVLGVPAAALGTTMMIGGGVVGATELYFSHADYRFAQSELDLLIAGQLSSSTDQYSQSQALELRDEMSSALWDAGLNLGFSAVGAGGLVRGLRAVARHSSKTINLERLNTNAAQLADSIPLRRAREVLSEEEFSNLFGRILYLPEHEQAMVLREINRLNNTKADPLLYKRIGEAIEEQAKRCG